MQLDDGPLEAGTISAAIRCAAEAKVIVLRADFPLAERPTQIARRVLVRLVATALQVDSRLEGLSNRNAPVYTVEVEESLASVRLEGTLLREPRPLLA